MATGSDTWRPGEPMPKGVKPGDPKPDPYGKAGTGDLDDGISYVRVAVEALIGALVGAVVGGSRGGMWGAIGGYIGGGTLGALESIAAQRYQQAIEERGARQTGKQADSFVIKTKREASKIKQARDRLAKRIRLIKVGGGGEQEREANRRLLPYLQTNLRAYDKAIGIANGATSRARNLASGKWRDRKM